MRRLGLKDLWFFFGYALLFAALREVSVPHWSISTGLRLGAFLLFPMDYWPIIIGADCLGSLIYDEGNSAWFFCSAVLPSFVAPIPAYLLRVAGWNSAGTTLTRSALLLLKCCALLALLLSCLSVATLSLIHYGEGAKHMDGGPVYFFLVFFIGHYLGALMVVPVLATYEWIRRGRLLSITDKSSPSANNEKLETMIAVCTIAALTLINIESGDRTVRIATALLMLFPGALVALRRGWLSAVTLTCLANLALRLTLRDRYDSYVIQEQILMMIVITITLGIGANVTELRTKLSAYERERHAHLLLARQNLSWGDAVVRRGALELERHFKEIQELRDSLEQESAFAMPAATNGNSKMSAIACANARWNMGVVAPTLKVPAAISSLKLDTLEVSGMRVALAFGPLASQLREAGIYYGTLITTRAGELPEDLQLHLYRMAYEFILSLCHDHRPHKVLVRLRVMNGAKRTIALRIRVWPGKKDVSSLPGPCLMMDGVRSFAKTFDGRVKDKSYHENPCVTVFLRDV